MDNMDYTFTIPLATHYGKPNVNGIIYTKEAIENMMNSIRFKELEKNKCLFITPGYPKKGEIDLSTVLGRVESIDIEKGEAVIKLTNRLAQILLEDGCSVRLGMNYIADSKDNPVHEMKFISYSLLDVNTGHYIL